MADATSCGAEVQKIAGAVGILNFKTKIKQFEPNSDSVPAKLLPFK